MNLEMLQKEAEAAQRSMQDYHAAMMAFQAECMRGDREAQEKERLRAVTALESYLDHQMAVAEIQKAG